MRLALVTDCSLPLVPDSLAGGEECNALDPASLSRELFIIPPAGPFATQEGPLHRAPRSKPQKEPPMTNSLRRLIPLATSMLVAVLLVQCALSQEEIVPPQGKGRVVVFVSGIAGPKHDKALSEAIAALGYYVYICDGRQIAKMPGGNLRAAIQAAQQSPHALPGKIALVGVSLGGGFSLALGSEWPDLVAVDIVWYPATGFAARLPGFTRRISVPVLMFAGEADHFENCCMIETARAIEASAKANNAPFELVTYPGADHDFIKGGKNYNPTAYEDALNRTAARLKAAFASPGGAPVETGRSSNN